MYVYTIHMYNKYTTYWFCFSGKPESNDGKENNWTQTSFLEASELQLRSVPYF